MQGEGDGEEVDGEDEVEAAPQSSYVYGGAPMPGAYPPPMMMGPGGFPPTPYMQPPPYGPPPYYGAPPMPMPPYMHRWGVMIRES